MARRKSHTQPTRASARLRRQKDKDNAQPLADLPPELLLQVSEYLCLDDRSSLSAINSQFRHSLAPHLFRTLRADNLPQDTNALERVVTKYGKHVKKLFFVLFLDAGDEQYCSVHETPSIVWDLLDGRALPNVENLGIYFSLEPDDFNGNGWNGDGHGDSTYIFSNEESFDCVRRKERKFHWRALYNECLGAVSLRSRPLKRLDLWNYPLKKCTVQATRQWEILLNGLDEFTIGLWGGEGEDDGCSNTHGPYLKAIEELRDNFFQHLTSSKRVKLEANWINAFGGQFQHHVLIPLAPTDLPKVEHLELKFGFIDEALLTWLKARHGQLKALQLVHCFAATEFEAMIEDSVTWAALFACVRKSQPMLDDLTFQTFQCCPHHDDLSRKFSRFDPYAPFSMEDMSAEEKKEFRLEVVARSDRLPFKYKYLDDDFGMMCTNAEVSVKRFWEGIDQKEFTSLIKMVENNKRNTGRT